MSDTNGRDNPREAHWQEVYETKATDEVSWFQAEPSRSLAFIEKYAPERAASIIDVGAGASRLVDRLLENGYRKLAVLDIADAALRQVRERLAARADQVEWFVSDVLSFAAPHTFDIWHDRAVFHFLTDAADREAYIRVAKDTVVPGGLLIVATFAVGGPTRCSGLEVAQYDADRITRVFGSGFDLLESMEEVHRTPAGKEQAFTYFVLRRQ